MYCVCKISVQLFYIICIKTYAFKNQTWEVKSYFQGRDRLVLPIFSSVIILITTQATCRCPGVWGGCRLHTGPIWGQSKHYFFIFFSNFVGFNLKGPKRFLPCYRKGDDIKVNFYFCSAVHLLNFWISQLLYIQNHKIASQNFHLRYHNNSYIWTYQTKRTIKLQKQILLTPELTY